MQFPYIKKAFNIGLKYVAVAYCIIILCNTHTNIHRHILAYVCMYVISIRYLEETKFTYVSIFGTRIEEHDGIKISVK